MFMSSTAERAGSKGRADLLPWLIAGAGLLVMYVPTLISLFNGLWSTDDQGHGPIVLGVAIWLIYRRWGDLTSDEATAPKPLIAWPLIVICALAYALGRSQGIWIFEV